MSASIPAAVIRAVTGWYVKRIDAEKKDVGKTRRLWDLGARFLIPAFGVKRTIESVGGVESEWHTPKGAADGKVLLYLHGGAFVMGNYRTHRQLAGHLARAGRIKTLVPDFRLAPEHKFPASIDDCIDVFRALVADGYAPGNIIVAGDSAGGGIAVGTMLKLRDLGEPLPGGAILLSPFLDFTVSGESIVSRADVDPWFRPENIPVVANYYCEPDQLQHPYASPIFADVDGLPPLFIQVGDREILLSDSERLANMQRAAGGDVELEVWPDMWHVFQVCINKMPESRRAIRRIGEYVQGLDS